MALPNSENITSQLAKLPDQALKQMAMMHKADPYILPLIISEDGRRKQVRQAAQAQMAMPQPKVADAAVDQIGIAQLPTPNMQQMADGGIAGYDDNEFNFAQSSEPVLRMADGGHIPRYQGNTRDGSLVGDIPGFLAVQPRAQFTQQGAPENTPFFQRMFESISSSNKDRQLAMIEQKIAQGKATPEEIVFYETQKAKAADAPQISAPKSVMNPDEAAMAAEKAARFKPTDKAPTDKAPSAAPAPQAALPTGGTSIKDAQDLGSKFYDFKGIKGQLEQQEAQERQDITNEKEARIARQAAFNKEQGPAMAGYEKLLKSEEMQDATDKEKAGLTALFKGFLSMAAGESPNAVVNIAKGAMAGLGDYSDSLKEFKKSAKERNKAMASIEDARRAEAKGDFKAVEDAEDKANTYLRASKRHGIDAIINATGKSAEVSAGLYKSMVDNASANARTMMQVNAPSGIEKIVDRMARDPKFAAEYKNYASIGPEARGDQSVLAKFAGPQGLIALQMLDAQGPEGKAQADLIRQKLQAAFLTPTSKPTGPVRD
jgi:hypothetical protein